MTFPTVSTPGHALFLAVTKNIDKYLMDIINNRIKNKMAESLFLIANQIVSMSYELNSEQKIDKETLYFYQENKMYKDKNIIFNHEKGINNKVCYRLAREITLLLVNTEDSEIIKILQNYIMKKKNEVNTCNDDTQNNKKENDNIVNKNQAISEEDQAISEREDQAILEEENQAISEENQAISKEENKAISEGENDNNSTDNELISKFHKMFKIFFILLKKDDHLSVVIKIT
ncbi:22433_t:CDS:2 [Cetraspora pellucida]|uniref:22433_t:CDS:1 n=1 Tax=Cetraspora pellucida TaxID=1433469 RepID=A0A9N8VAS0_9GLOM|nr:22433_t:CDS:2 [Cetraspora pellucida]